MKAQTAITFADWLAALPEVQPCNLEHLQARAKEMHRTVDQILDSPAFPFDVMMSFPTLGEVTCKTDAQIARWFADFMYWFDNLESDVWRALNDAPVIAR